MQKSWDSLQGCGVCMYLAPCNKHLDRLQLVLKKIANTFDRYSFLHQACPLLILI